MRAALLVIDVQKGVVEDCHDREGVVNRIAGLVNGARSKSSIPVIWVQDEQDFAFGSDQWQLAAPLERRKDETLIRKRYRDCFAGTELAALLQRLDVKHLAIVGAQSDFCVRTAASRAAADGYDVTLVKDGHTTTDCTFDGLEVKAAQIIAHTNFYWSGLKYPSSKFNLVYAENIDWDGL